MKLTDKCKVDFEKWSIKNYGLEYDVINLLKDSMKYGVYVDYFDSVDKEIAYEILNDEFEYYADKELTLEEARTKAIEKANEIRNEQL